MPLLRLLLSPSTKRNVITQTIAHYCCLLTDISENTNKSSQESIYHVLRQFRRSFTTSYNTEMIFEVAFLYVLM